MKIFGYMVAVGLAIPTAAAAQAPADDPNTTIIYQKKTVVSFGDDTIDGDLTRPDGEYLESRKRVRHSNLIRIRENFRTKVLQSVTRL
jgi:hypothetical protein